MESELPTKTSLESQAASGRPITQAEATAIAHAESDMTRRGSIKGGTAATAQALHDRQQNFYEVAGEVARKPSEEVTREDAARVQRFEVSYVLPVQLFGWFCWRSPKPQTSVTHGTQH